MHQFKFCFKSKIKSTLQNANGKALIYANTISPLRVS